MGSSTPIEEGEDSVTKEVEAYYRYSHGEHPLILRTVADMDALIDALLAESRENNTAVMYHLGRPFNAAGVPDHELRIAVIPKSQTGALRYMGFFDKNGGTCFSQGDTGKTGEVLHYYMGHDEEFPADSEIPLADIRTAAREFLITTGARPTAIRWQPDPFRLTV